MYREFFSAIYDKVFLLFEKLLKKFSDILQL